MLCIQKLSHCLVQSRLEPFAWREQRAQPVQVIPALAVERCGRPPFTLPHHLLALLVGDLLLALGAHDVRILRQMLSFLVLVPSDLRPFKSLVFSAVWARTKPASLISQIKLSFNATHTLDEWLETEPKPIRSSDVQQVGVAVASFIA